MNRILHLDDEYFDLEKIEYIHTNLTHGAICIHFASGKEILLTNEEAASIFIKAYEAYHDMN